MINAAIASQRTQGFKISRLRPEFQRLLATPALAGFVIGWIESESDKRFAAALIWAVLSVSGCLLNDLFTRPFAPVIHRKRWPLVAALTAGFLVASPLSVLLNLSFGEVFRACGIERHGLETLASMSAGSMASSALAPYALWIAINLVSCRMGGGLYGFAWPAAHRTDPGGLDLPVPNTPPQPEFMQKVRPAIQGRVTAINAELHYVRVITDKGNDLIHYRFCDAIAAMQPVGGIQIHRSWCVMLEDIESIAGRSVTLRNAMTVPVGRSFQKAVRQALARSARGQRSAVAESRSHEPGWVSAQS